MFDDYLEIVLTGIRAESDEPKLTLHLQFDDIAALGRVLQSRQQLTEEKRKKSPKGKTIKEERT